MATLAVDHCTAFPEQILGVVLAGCCARHDQAYDAGDSFLDFLVANLDLGTCVSALGQSTAVLALGILMAAGTTLLGLPFWLRARWRRRRASSQLEG